MLPGHIGRYGITHPKFVVLGRREEFPLIAAMASHVYGMTNMLPGTSERYGITHPKLLSSVAAKEFAVDRSHGATLLADQYAARAHRKVWDHASKVCCLWSLRRVAIDRSHGSHIIGMTNMRQGTSD